MLVYNVTSIKEEITGYAGVCHPQEDANGNWTLSQSCLTDKLLEDIWPDIEACPLIEFEPKPRPEGV